MPIASSTADARRRKRAEIAKHYSVRGPFLFLHVNLLDNRSEFSSPLEMTVRKDGEDYLDAAQNARIVLAAEQYYRIMYRGSTESWNLRDRHMFSTLQHVMEARGSGAKAIVWAHNSHIGNAAATAMGWQGEFNIGELCKTAYGDEAALIGFGTDRGTVAAADDWNEPMQVMRVLPSRADSYERVFGQEPRGWRNLPVPLLWRAR